MKRTELAGHLDAIGWTQVALARRVGADAATVSRWASGAARCPAGVLRYVRLIAAFHTAHPYPGLQTLVAPMPTKARKPSVKTRDRAQWAAVAAANQRDQQDE